MNEFISKDEHETRVNPSNISAAELAAFLSQLAALYSSPTSGNPHLSYALKELAKAVGRRDPEFVRPSRKREEKSEGLSAEKVDAFRRFDNSSVRAFLADETRTKTELLALASARFAMPTSQLRRLRTEEVREAITSALLHENSIEIISSEAGKDGASRTS